MAVWFEILAVGGMGGDREGVGRGSGWGGFLK